MPRKATTNGRPSWSFWAISSLALIYNGAGVANFISQMDPETVAALPELYRTLIETRPDWTTAAFAVAVFGGVLGSILLFLRIAYALHVFMISLAGAAVTMIHTAAVASPAAIPEGAIVGNLVQILITLFLAWYVGWAQRRGWMKRNRKTPTSNG